MNVMKPAYRLATIGILIAVPIRVLSRHLAKFASLIPFTHRPPAIDCEYLAGNEFRFVAQEEHGGGMEITFTSTTLTVCPVPATLAP